MRSRLINCKVLDAHIKEAQSVVDSKQTIEAVETVK